MIISAIWMALTACPNCLGPSLLVAQGKPPLLLLSALSVLWGHPKEHRDL